MTSCVTELTTIEFKNMTFPIQYFFVADWKFMSLVLGLYAANSNFPCLVCHWTPAPISDEPPKKKPKPLEFAPESSRSEKARATILNSKATAANHMGYKCARLFPSSIVVLFDVLHMKTRVCDKLLELLLVELGKCDDLNCKRDNIITDNQVYQMRWFKFITEECKIKRNILPYNEKSKAKFTRSFTGGDYDKIIEKINIERDFPTIDHCKDVQRIWTLFGEILKDIKLASSTITEHQTKHWHNLLVSVYREYSETPYMHAMHKHLSDQVEAHGDITLFSQEPVEKLNDFTTKEYLNATNKWESYLEQILLHRYRIDYYEKENCLPLDI